jgi:hypothetical protein
VRLLRGNLRVTMQSGFGTELLVCIQLAERTQLDARMLNASHDAGGPDG